MDNKKHEIWEKKEDIIKEHLIGIGLMCLGFFMVLPAIFYCN